MASTMAQQVFSEIRKIAGSDIPLPERRADAAKRIDQFKTDLAAAHLQPKLAEEQKKVVTIPHFACAGCKALFLDTDDLGSVAVSNICGAKTGEPAIGSCPVCGSDVWPRNADGVTPVYRVLSPSMGLGPPA